MHADIWFNCCWNTIFKTLNDGISLSKFVDLFVYPNYSAFLGANNQESSMSFLTKSRSELALLFLLKNTVLSRSLPVQTRGYIHKYVKLSIIYRR